MDISLLPGGLAPGIVGLVHEQGWKTGPSRNPPPVSHISHGCAKVSGTLRHRESFWTPHPYPPSHPPGPPCASGEQLTRLPPPKLSPFSAKSSLSSSQPSLRPCRQAASGHGFMPGQIREQIGPRQGWQCPWPLLLPTCPTAPEPPSMREDSCQPLLPDAHLPWERRSRSPRWALKLSTCLSPPGSRIRAAISNYSRMGSENA